HEALIELRFFKSVPFSGATLIAVAAYFAFAGFFFLNTLYLQDVRGLSALDAGVDTLPMAGAMALFASLSGRVVARFGARPSLVVAGVTMGLGSFMLTTLSPTTSFTRLFVSYVIFGIGFGMVNAPITNTAVSGMPASQAGVASAVASTSRQIGQVLGVGVVGSALAVGLRQRHPFGLVAVECVRTRRARDWNPEHVEVGTAHRVPFVTRIRDRRGGPA